VPAKHGDGQQRAPGVVHRHRRQRLDRLKCLAQLFRHAIAMLRRQDQHIRADMPQRRFAERELPAISVQAQRRHVRPERIANLSRIPPVRHADDGAGWDVQ
jgi:hypothetical protein